MNKQECYRKTLYHLRAYVNCVSILVFFLCVGVLGAAYSPLHWISTETLASVSGPSGYFVVLVFSGALVLSGFHITEMWSENSVPTVMEVLLLFEMQIVSALASYFAAALLMPIFQSSIVLLLCINLSLFLALICFVRTRNKYIK